jgi:menaquinone-dependent protoporphyrinogen IX oxidase
MRAVIVYESMYGNTRRVADAIARGLGPDIESIVVPVAQARPDLLNEADLVVVGGPTHVHGMSRASTRKGAVDMARKPGSNLTLAPGAEGPGLRDWFATLGQLNISAAAFDTRLEGAAMFTGRASSGIGRLLRRHGLTLVAKPESFLVTSKNQLRAGEEDRAWDWGRRLSDKMATKLAAATSATGA